MKTSSRHAVVVGSSVAGLASARALYPYFDHITLLERDVAPHLREFRKGAPQGRHPHILLKGGENVLEEGFPGLRQELIGLGGLEINIGSDMDWNMFGQWRQCFRSALTTVACSRPLLETTLYRRVAALPKVTLLHGREVVGLQTDESRGRVTGLLVRERQSAGIARLDADLVVDASGRDSDAPNWLTELGYQPPSETVVTARAGYATRIYNLAPEMMRQFRAVYIQPNAPSNTRGCVMLPMEGNRVHLTLIGMGGDYPPTGEAEFLEFARSLTSPRPYEFIRSAQPASDIWGFRRADNRLRAYDKLPRYLDGLVVIGDAVFAPNPVYGQGMTIAALASQILGRCLKQQEESRPEDPIPGLARLFQKQLARVVEGPWQMATGEDRRWPVGGAMAIPDLPTRIMQAYVGRLLRVSLTNVMVAESFSRVQQMLDGPQALFHPRLLWALLTTSLPSDPPQKRLLTTELIQNMAGLSMER